MIRYRDKTIKQNQLMKYSNHKFKYQQSFKNQEQQPFKIIRVVD